MGLENPTDNIGTVLAKGAMKLKKYEKRLSHEGNSILTLIPWLTEITLQ